MCGIAGIFSHKKLSNKYLESNLINKMIFSQKNRGPDKLRILKNEKTVLASARLEIIDVNGGQQPFLNDAKNIILVFNGEIFNYIELREDLKIKGHSFKTNSDTEVLLKMYEEYQYNMLEKLNGQFAFCIVDLKKNSVFLARDRVGIRPLFYTINDETIFFASTIKSILMNDDISKKINYDAFFQISNLWTTINDTTFLKNIKTINPGEYLIYQDSKITKKKYWDINFLNKKNIAEKNVKDDVYNMLEKSVKLRLRSDVKVSAYFSGGLDSSIVMYLLNKMHTNTDCYSIIFDDKFYDESDYQAELYNKFNIKNKKQINISSNDIGNVFDQVIFHTEQPIFRTAPAPLYLLSQEVNRDKCKVVLTGEGADEIAWGYDLFKEIKFRNLMAANFEKDENFAKIKFINRFLEQSDSKYDKFMLDFYKKFSKQTGSLFFSHLIKFSNAKYISHFFSKDIKKMFEKYDIKEKLSSELPDNFKKFNNLQKGQYLEMKTLLPNYLLSSQGDRMSMANSVEGRYPFLDHNVIEYFASMSDNYKLNDFNEKYILKETFKPFLPKKIISRHKHPYRAPEGISLINKSTMGKYLNENAIQDSNIFNPEMIKKLISKINKRGIKSSFVDNFTIVLVTSTMIFLDQLKNNFYINLDASEINNIETIYVK